MAAPTEAEIAAFIRARGVTRCPTACAAPTQGAGDAADRTALRNRADRLEAIREQRSGPYLSRRAWNRGATLQAG